jgi:two-component system, cell cycle sensor histidine kinase and response regulator CckA
MNGGSERWGWSTDPPLPSACSGGLIDRTTFDAEGTLASPSLASRASTRGHLHLRPETVGPPAHILIIDDEKTDREALKKHLIPDGFAVTTAESGEEALAIIAIEPPDLILVDVMMPGMDGYEVVRRLKAEATTRDIPIVMVSALEDQRSLIVGLNAGAADFLRKPVDPTELRARLENLLRLKAHGDRQNNYGIQLEAEIDSRTEDLIASERLYRETFDDAPVGIIHADLEGHWIRVNQRLCKLLGYSREELLTREVQARVVSEVETTSESVTLKLECTDGQHIVSEDRYRRKDDQLIWVRINMTVHSDPNGSSKHLILVLEDITGQRALEAQFRQAGKMDALGGLAAGLAHDFNNLLSIIVSYSEMAISTLDPGNAMRTDLEAVHSAGLRAATLTRQLLAFSRHQVLCPEVVELNEVVHGMQDILRRLIREDVELVTTPSEHDATILIDRSQLEQIIMNLAINARDAMPKGGTLTIGTMRIDEAAHEQHHGCAGKGPHVMLTVTDNGSGIDVDTQARMFDPFFTTKPLGIGTGLGLSTVFGIVRQSGGTIWVESKIGSGTTFFICFPRATEPPFVAAKRPLRRRGRGTETILLVEDDEAVRLLTTKLLKQAGYNVLVANNAHDAASLCDRHPQPIQLLLTDVVMPGTSGWKLAADLRERRPDIKVLYMSGYADGAQFDNGDRDASASFLEKPISPDSLARKVREALNESDV